MTYFLSVIKNAFSCPIQIHKRFEHQTRAEIINNAQIMFNLTDKLYNEMIHVFVHSYVWIMWSAPLQIAIALWQLYETIGPSLFAGFAIMVVMMPLNGIVAAKQRNLQIAQMKLKDERIKMMNEVLSGVRVRKTCFT